MVAPRLRKKSPRSRMTANEAAERATSATITHSAPVRVNSWKIDRVMSVRSARPKGAPSPVHSGTPAGVPVGPKAPCAAAPSGPTGREGQANRAITPRAAPPRHVVAARSMALSRSTSTGWL